MSFRVVMAQLGSTDDKQINLGKAKDAMIQAVDGYGAQLVVFPEVFMSHFSPNTPHERVRQDAESLDGPFVQEMQRLAQEHRAWIVFGTREAPEDTDDLRVYNTTVVLDDNGGLVASYRKTHLYDAFGAMESKTIKPGNELFHPILTPFGRMGLFVCYELRFPEIARSQAVDGADFIVVPSGWVRGPMKEHHWRTLVTARALENTVFVVACDQASDYYTGCSLVVDPMGVPLVQGTETECMIPCDIELNRLHEVRQKLPSTTHRRQELYL